MQMSTGCFRVFVHPACFNDSGDFILDKHGLILFELCDQSLRNAVNVAKTFYVDCVISDFLRQIFMVKKSEFLNFSF